MLLLLLSIFLILTSASLPQQYTSKVLVTANSVSHSGTLWFDFVLKGIAVQFDSDLGIIGGVIGSPNSTSQSTRIYGLSPESLCNVLTDVFWSDVPEWEIPDGCIYQGRTTIDSRLAEQWYCSRQEIPVLYYVTFYLSPVDYTFIYINATVPSPVAGIPIEVTVLFSETSEGPCDPIIFDTPPGCI